MLNLAACGGLLAVYFFFLGLYRVFIHPLAGVPGPKIAALTSWYTIYHDVFSQGRYIWKVQEMHQRYGPVVRIQPNVVHVNDPAFVDQVYPAQASDKRRDRAATVTNMFIEHLSVLPTGDHDLHRRRRAVLSPFFSQQNVRRLVPTINQVLEHLLHRIQGEDAQADGRVLTLNPLLRAATTDVIQSYAFGNGPKNILMDDCNASFFETLAPKQFVHFASHFPWISKLLVLLPPSLVLALNPSAKTFIGFMEDLANQVKQVQNGEREHDQKTIFHEILQSNIPEDEKSSPRLIDEAMVLTIAGSDTTATTLRTIIYHVLSNRAIFERLRRELESVMPDSLQPPDPAALDRLPFLNALIEETLRLYPSAVSRQDRVAPEQDLVYQYPDGHVLVLPAGTIVGMTAPLLNVQPSWHDNPGVFDPDRFIRDPKLLRRHLTFCKGGRQCLGINLAYQELQSFTAGIFRRFARYDPDAERQRGPSLELYATSLRDIQLFSDYVTAHPHPESLGLRVRVRTD